MPTIRSASITVEPDPPRLRWEHLAHLTLDYVAFLSLLVSVLNGIDAVLGYYLRRPDRMQAPPGG